MAVSDARATAEWYSGGLGFRLDDLSEFENGRALAYLSLGNARLVLEQSSDPLASGPSNVIKLGLLVPDLAELDRRILAAIPESSLQPLSTLPPPATDLDGWPTSYLLTRDPDGTLVQAFGRSEPTSEASWLLAAVTVPNLEEAVRWFGDQARYEEIDRPDTGDPRSLMRWGVFYLEVGEFGDVRSDDQESYGVSQLVFDSDRGGCPWLETPYGFRMRRCGVVR